MKTVRLTRRAERRLGEIARWTIDRFGPIKAEAYEDRLIGRLDALGRNEMPQGRPCDLLVSGKTRVTGLRYFREGGHFIIYRETDDLIVVIDFVHGARDLEGILQSIMQDIMGIK